MSDYMLVDMAVIAFANAMRVQSVIGNTALILESEMFCQPTLRAKWRTEYGGRPEDIRGLAVEEHVKRLGEMLLPMAERFHRMAEGAVEALRRQRQAPAVEVERAVPRRVRLMPAGRAGQPALGYDLNAGGGDLGGYEETDPDRLAAGVAVGETGI
jgi:hypothetical protein